MINGRRAFSFEDINALPLGFIESVEILKDGASATYGADAVAGVVNFKLRHALKGGEIDLLYGNTNLGVANDAAVRTGYLVGGLAGEKYNLTAGASYYDRGAIFARDTFLSSLTDRRRLGGHNLARPQFPGRISRNTSVANTGARPGRPAGTFSNANLDLVLIDPANTPDNHQRLSPLRSVPSGKRRIRFSPIHARHSGAGTLRLFPRWRIQAAPAKPAHALRYRALREYEAVQWPRAFPLHAARRCSPQQSLQSRRDHSADRSRDRTCKPSILSQAHRFSRSGLIPSATLRSRPGTGNAPMTAISFTSSRA